MVATYRADTIESSVWLSVPDGYYPIYFEEVFGVPGSPERRTTEVRWQKTSGGHHYPERLVHKTMITVGGERYASEEVIDVVHADLGGPIDPSVFTLDGLGLNEGQAVGLPGLATKDYPTWRNGKLDTGYTLSQRENDIRSSPSTGVPAGTPHAAAPYPTTSNAVWIVGVIAGVLAVVTAVAAVVIRRRRAAA